MKVAQQSDPVGRIRFQASASEAVRLAGRLVVLQLGGSRPVQCASMFSRVLPVDALHMSGSGKCTLTCRQTVRAHAFDSSPIPPATPPWRGPWPSRTGDQLTTSLWSRTLLVFIRIATAALVHPSAFARKRVWSAMALISSISCAVSYHSNGRGVVELY